MFKIELCVRNLLVILGALWPGGLRSERGETARANSGSRRGGLLVRQSWGALSLCGEEAGQLAELSLLLFRHAKICSEP